MADNLGPASVQVTKGYKAPNPSEGGHSTWLWIALAGGAALLLSGGLGGSSSTATTSGVATTSGTTTTSPVSGAPGTPALLQQVGGTATSVIVTCSMEATATAYYWHQANTGLLLATSPTNTAQIDGLQTNTGYSVYVVAGNASGLSAPSQPLLVETGAGSPETIINNYGTGTTTAPTLSVAVTAQPGSPTLGESVTVQATLSGGPNSTAPTVLNGTTAGPVAWVLTIDGPTGTTSAKGAGYSVVQTDFTPGATGTYTVTASATYQGTSAAAHTTVSVQTASSGGGGGGGYEPPPSSSPSSPRPTAVVLSGSGSVTQGSNIVVQASAQGGSQPVYQFWLKPPGGSWQQSGGYSSADTATFIASQTGTYQVQAFAKDASAPETQGYETASNILSVAVRAASQSSTGSQPSQVSVTISGPHNGTVGQPLGFTASAEGIPHPVYQFWAGGDGHVWAQSGVYRTSNGFTFTPPQTGTYRVVAFAKDASAPEQAAYETQSQVLDVTVSG